MEDLFQQFRRHADARIRNRHQDVIAGNDFRMPVRIFAVEMDQLGFNGQQAAIGHGVPGIYG